MWNIYSRLINEKLKKAKYMGKTIKLKNDIYLDSSSVANICNLGKYIHLVKNTTQIIQPTTTTEMVWESIWEDTTGGLLTKVGNKIKIGKGINNIFVHAQWRDNSIGDTTFAYIMKNGERYSVNLYDAQMIAISEIVPVTEGDEISINTYQQGAAATTIPGDEASEWEYFKTMILN